MSQNKSLDQPTVFVIDDDEAVRTSLESLFRSVGMNARSFGSTREFLQIALPATPCCLVLDVRLPGSSGLDFQTELDKAGVHIPIVFITGHGDIPMSVKAMKAGAVEFLTKPFRNQDLLDAVHAAVDRSAQQIDTDKLHAKVQDSFGSLTPREREVIALVTSGLMNKQIAAKLDVSEITVKVHRGNVMRKMGAKSLADLVRMFDRLHSKHRDVS